MQIKTYKSLKIKHKASLLFAFQADIKKIVVVHIFKKIKSI